LTVAYFELSSDHPPVKYESTLEQPTSALRVLSQLRARYQSYVKGNRREEACESNMKVLDSQMKQIHLTSSLNDEKTLEVVDKTTTTRKVLAWDVARLIIEQSHFITYSGRMVFSLSCVYAVAPYLVRFSLGKIFN
jgi:hypothetical protein